MNQGMVPRTKAADEKFCTECGEVINAKAEICPRCGVRQMPPPGALGTVTVNGRNRLVAALLALFTGGIGGHKFYLGQITTGIVYLLFCWTFIPSLLGLIEGIFLLAMTDETFNRKYGNI